MGLTFKKTTFSSQNINTDPDILETNDSSNNVNYDQTISSVNPIVASSCSNFNVRGHNRHRSCPEDKLRSLKTVEFNNKNLQKLELLKGKIDIPGLEKNLKAKFSDFETISLIGKGTCGKVYKKNLNQKQKT